MEERLSTLAILFALGIDTITSYYPFQPAGLPIDPQGVLKKEPFGPEYRRWTDLAGRLALLLRGGSHICDVAVYYPIEAVQGYLLPRAGGEASPRAENPDGSEGKMEEIWHPHSSQVIRKIEDTWIDSCRELLQSQRDFEILDDEAVEQASIAGGKMSLGYESYRAFVLTCCPVIKLSVLERLVEFQKKGGLVLLVGSRPEEPAEPGKEKEFEHACRELARGKLFIAPEPRRLPSLLSEILEPDVYLSPPAKAVLSLHRKHTDRDTYLFVNTSGERLEFTLRVRASGRRRLFWPVDGKIEKVPSGDSGLPISLKPYESFALICSR